MKPLYSQQVWRRFSLAQSGSSRPSDGTGVRGEGKRSARGVRDEDKRSGEGRGNCKPLRALVFALIAGIAPLLLVSGCSREQSLAPTQRGKGMPVPVSIAVAGQKDVAIQLNAIGAARAFASVSVKARVDGQLARVAFKQGDEVKKGDLIFLIDPRPYESARNQAQ